MALFGLLAGIVMTHPVREKTQTSAVQASVVKPM
jgi:hypothetical protein